MLRDAQDPERIANYVGMSRGEVVTHLESINARVKQALHNQRIEAIKNYEPSEADNNQTADGGDILVVPADTVTRVVGVDLDLGAAHSD